MKLREKIGFAVAVLSVVQVLVIGLAVYTFNARIIIEREREFLITAHRCGERGSDEPYRGF